MRWPAGPVARATLLFAAALSACLAADHEEAPSYARTRVDLAPPLKLEFPAGAEALAFSPRKRLAVACADGAVHLWAKAPGKAAEVVRGAEGAKFRSVVFSPAGDRLAFAGPDRRIHVLETAAWKEACVLGPADGFTSISFSPDAKALASWGIQGCARLWSPSAEKNELQRLPGQGTPDSPFTQRLGAVSFSPDGRMLAGAGEPDGKIRLWDASTPGAEPFQVFAGHASPVIAVAFLDDALRLVSASWDDSIRFWDVAAGKELDCIFEPKVSVDAFACSPDGRFLAAGDCKGYIRLIETASRRTVLALEPGLGEGKWIASLAFSADSRRLAMADGSSTVRVWDLAPKGWAPRVETEPFQPEELNRLWADLAGDDIQKGYLASWDLTRGGVEVAAFLAGKLSPAAAPDPAKIQGWIRDLGAARFDLREAASGNLARLGRDAVAPLKEACETASDPEVRARIMQIVEEIDAPLPAPKDWGALRAIGVLEGLPVPEAKTALEGLAKAPAGLRLAREAGSALARLAVVSGR